MLRVFQSQELDCIRYGGDDPRVLRILGGLGCAEQCDALSPQVAPSQVLPSARELVHRSRLVGALVAVDLVTKLLAIRFLDGDVLVNQRAFFQLVLRTNPSGLGTWARALVGTSSTVQRAASSLGYLALAAYLVLVRRTQWSLSRKLLAGVALTALSQALAAFLFEPILRLLPEGSLPAVSRVGPALFFLTLWALARPGAWRTTTTLFAAAALGNWIGLLVPPHEVIDFIYSRPFSAIFRCGIVNVADIYFNAALVCLVALTVRWVLQRLRLTKRGA